ncbi:BCCT family transporter [Maribacter sp. 2-571]|uniref:BCCT family transporter n=1 Tax=Maribacter sp. 2-571 TaxID=3417569 RepID=UPI003D32D753
MKILFNNAILSISIGLILAFTAVVFFATEASYASIETGSIWVRNHFGHFYLYLGLGCVLLLVGIACSPFGNIRLGAKDSTPEHSLWAWTAMLYSAGMGAGILLRAVQEPVFMQQNPPFPSNHSPEILALEFTFYQWGFTAWAFYGLFAMVVGYALFVRKKAVLVSATVSDSISNKTVLGIIDIIVVITTVFGLIAALGLGTTQIKGGLDHLFSVDFGLGTTLSLVSGIALIAFYSAWKGIDKGIKIISKVNILITMTLLALIFFLSDVSTILLNFVQALYAYIVEFIPMSLALGNYDPGIAFLTDWTFYYWAFWLAWAPFTGIFIARISKGRTLRQLLLGVLFIPSLGTFFWFSVFGTAAFQTIADSGAYQGEFGNVFSSIFIFFESYPFPALWSGITIFLLIGFLVTSIDSAVFVLSMFTDNGKKEPAKMHRFLWSVFVLLATMALLLLGTAKAEIDVLSAVQKLLIITSLPFALLIIPMSWLFVKTLVKR